MLPSPPSHELAFFQVAATLIPLLLLGGVLIDRLRPPPWQRIRVRHEVAFFALVTVAAAVVFAEVLAIETLIVGQSFGFSRVFVAAALVFGMLAIVAAVVVPWLTRLRESGRQTPYIPLAALGVVLAVGTTLTLIQALDRAKQHERAVAIDHTVRDLFDQQEKLQSEIDARSRHRDARGRELARIATEKPKNAGDRHAQALRIRYLNAQDKSDNRLDIFAYDQIIQLTKQQSKLMQKLP